MKMRSRLIALLGLTVGSLYVANKIQETQAIKPHISAKLPKKGIVSPIVPQKNTLPKALIQSFQTQIIEMAKSLDPNTEIMVVHFLEVDEKRSLVMDKILEEAGYEKILSLSKTKYQKKLKADAQTICDAVFFTAQTAKTHKFKYFGWDLTNKGK